MRAIRPVAHWGLLTDAPPSGGPRRVWTRARASGRARGADAVHRAGCVRAPPRPRRPAPSEDDAKRRRRPRLLRPPESKGIHVSKRRGLACWVGRLHAVQVRNPGRGDGLRGQRQRVRVARAAWRLHARSARVPFLARSDADREGMVFAGTGQSMWSCRFCTQTGNIHQA